MSGNNNDTEVNSKLDSLIAAMHRMNTRMDSIQAEFSEMKGSKGKDVNHQYYEEREEAQSTLNRARRYGERNPHIDNDLSSIKIKMPPFTEKNDFDAYLEWEQKVKMIFNCHKYSDEKKVQLATLEFSGYALIWWNELVMNRRRMGELPIGTWEDMRRIMRRKYILSYYYREIHHKLQRMTQGSKLVEEYFQDMETLMIRVSITEDDDQKVAHFLGGLNRQIADIIELQS